MRFLKRAEETLLVVLLLTAFGTLIFQVLSRYLFPYPLAWTEELARFLFLWIVFLGAAYLFRNNSHIAIDFAISKLPLRARTIIYQLMQICILTFVVIVAWLGFDLAWKVRNLPTIALEISSSFEYLAVPVACALMALRTLNNIYRVFRDGLPDANSASLL